MLDYRSVVRAVVGVSLSSAWTRLQNGEHKTWRAKLVMVEHLLVFNIPRKKGEQLQMS